MPMTHTLESLTTKICLTILILVLALLGVSRFFETYAQSPLEASFTRAMVAFGVVRGINAVVSVAQGTEIAMEPGGVGVTLAPGEVLDPINDLIEQFSWIVLAAGTSLGAQRILLGMGAAQVTQGLLLAAALLLLVAVWRPSILPPTLRRVVVRAALVVLLLRFLVPVVVLANELVYRAFLNDDYEQSYTVLEQTEQEVRELQAEEEDAVTTADTGILDNLGRWWEDTTQRLNPSIRYRAFEQRLADTPEHIVNLIVVFLLQTIVFPLLFLWLALKSGRLLVSAAFWK